MAGLITKIRWGFVWGFRLFPHIPFAGPRGKYASHKWIFVHDCCVFVRVTAWLCPPPCVYVGMRVCPRLCTHAWSARRCADVSACACVRACTCAMLLSACVLLCARHVCLPGWHASVCVHAFPCVRLCGVHICVHLCKCLRVFLSACLCRTVLLCTGDVLAAM